MGKEKTKKGSGSKGLAGAISGGERPWIQVLAQMHDHTMILAEVPAKKFYYDANAIVDAMADVTGYYDFDMFNPFADLYNYEIEAMGAKMIYGENSMPTIDFREPLIKNPEDLTKLKAKEVDWRNDGRLPYVLGCIELSLEYGSNLGMFCSPFSMAVGMRSFPALIKDMRKRPQFAHELFTFITDDVLLPYLKVQNEVCDILIAVGADAWACVPNLSVKDMKEWVVPYNERLLEKAKKIGVMAMNVSGDYCEERLEKFDANVLHGCFDVEIASQGAPSLFLGMGRWQDYPLEPVLDYLAKYREQGINASIIATLNARLIRDGPVEKIISAVKRIIDAFAREHSVQFLFGNLPADAPSDHIHAGIAAVHTYGRYPIADNLDDIELKIPKRESFKEWKQKISKNQ